MCLLAGVGLEVVVLMPGVCPHALGAVGLLADQGTSEREDAAACREWELYCQWTHFNEFFGDALGSKFF